MIDLFHELDRRWAIHARPRLCVLGAGALIIQEPRHQRATKDSDVFETLELDAAVQAHVLALAGRDTDLHRRTRIFVEIVRNGIPLLPHAPLWLPIRAFEHFDLAALDITDVCVAKLIRFSATDREDIDAMIQLLRVPHDRFVERFRSAVDELAHEARASMLPKIVENFHDVETDMFGVSPTEIELPSWL